jgi:hypothetical protein
MKRIILAVIACALALLIASPTLSQPVPEPKREVPATKAALNAKIPPPAPYTKGEPKVKVGGKLSVVGEVPDEKPEAEPEGTAGYGKVAINHAIKLGFLLLSLLLTGFVTVLMKKFGFQAQTEKVNDVLDRAKGYAEQWALKKTKADAAAKPGGPAKMDEAVNFALNLAKEYKLPKKGKDWWEGQLESWLGMNGTTT